MKSVPTLESESRLIVDSIPGIVALLSATGEVEIVNPQLLEYFGQTLEELRNWGTNGTVHPDDLQHVVEVFGGSIASGTPYEIVQRLRRADGVYRWMENKGFPLRDPDGQIRRWCVLLTDIDERKHAETALQQSEQNLKLIIDTIPALVWGTDADGSAEFFNQHYLDYVGMTEEQVMGWGWTVAVHPDDLEGLRARWQDIKASGQPGEAEARLRRHDGKYRWFLFRANPFRDERGEIVKWYGANTDIEDRKLAQEALTANERDLRSIINTIPTHIYVLNTDGSVQHVNQAVMDYTGLTLEDVQQEDYRDRVIHPEDFRRVRAARAASLRRAAPFSTEQRVLGIDGQYRWFLVRYKPLLNKRGRIVRWYVAAFDIEDRKGGELRLKESESLFKTIFDEAGTGITLVDLKTGGPIKNNRALQKMLGRSEEELGRFETYDELTHPDDREKDSATFHELYDGKRDSLKIEKHFVLDDARSVWANVVFTLLRDDDGQPRYIIAIHEDITERKQSEETFRTIVETNPECVKVIDRDGTLQRVNAAGVAMSGALSEELLLGQCFYNFVAPEDRDRYREFNETVCTGHKGFLEFDLITALGERRHMETHAAPMLHSDGSIVQLGVTRDITDRKRTLERLQANQDLLDLAQKSAGAMAFDWYIQEEINQWSPEQESLFGLAPGAFDGTYQSWKRMMYEPDWPTVVQAIEHAHRTGVVEAEFRVVWPDGSLHWLATNGRMFFDEEGKPLRMVGFSSDVTRRKTAEVQLAGEKRLLEMVANDRPLPDILTALCSYVDETAPGCHCGVYLIDWDGPRVQLALGPTLPTGFNAALEGLYLTPKTGPCALAAFEKKQVITVDAENDELWRSSPFRTFALAHGLRSCWSTPIYSRSGEVLGTFAIYREKPAVPTSLQQDLITQVTHIASIAIERSQRDEALRRSEAFLAESQHLARTGSFAWNVATNKITWSEQLYRMYEFESGIRITPELIRTRVHPDDASLYEKMEEQHELGNSDFEWQYRLLMPDKSIKHLHATVHAFRNHQGEVEYVAAVQDITSRKAREEALRRREAELRRANEYLTIAQELSQTGSYTRDIVTDEQILSDEMYRIMDFDPAKKVTHEMFLARVHPEDLPIVENAQRLAIPTGEDVKMAYRIITDDGTVKHLRSSSRRLAEITDHVVYVGATQDVTEKRVAEEALRRSEAFLAEGQHLARTGNLSWRVATGEITWSEEMYRIFEFEPGTRVTLELIGSRVHPDDMPMLYDMVDRAQRGVNDFEYEHRILMPDSSIKYLHLIAHRAGDDKHGPEYIGAVQDVTQRRMSETALSEARSELARAARAMSLGVLTASIAHEVNQPLSGIITNASTCVRMLDADPPNVDGARETARRTIRDGNRASEVIKRLRSLFSRKEFTAESLDLNELALEVIALSRNELQKGQVVLQTEFAKHLSPIEGDRVQIQQVILNLLLNAADAMSGVECQPRQLTIKTELERGERVRLSVRDVGTGFTAADADKLFDAFYTTKTDGMGIGLSVSRSIIESHQGRLWAAPNEGPGAVFSFSIPVRGKSEAALTGERSAEIIKT